MTFFLILKTWFFLSRPLKLPKHRIEKFNLKDFYKLETLKKLLEHKSVILAESNSLKKVRDYFHLFNLIETDEDFYFFLLDIQSIRL